ncbi:MAG: hypothetical protein WDM84_06320 [Bauldia sp.]
MGDGETDEAFSVHAVIVTERLWLRARRPPEAIAIAALAANPAIAPNPLRHDSR